MGFREVLELVAHPLDDGPNLVLTRVVRHIPAKLRARAEFALEQVALVEEHDERRAREQFGRDDEAPDAHRVVKAIHGRILGEREVKGR